MIIIGLSGPKGSGKSTVSERLSHGHSFQWLLFRGPDTLRCDNWQQQFGNHFNFHRARGTAGVVFYVKTDAEAQFVRSQGGQIWNLQRPEFLQQDRAGAKGVMPTERDRGILNDAGVLDLFKRVDELVEVLLELQLSMEEKREQTT